MVAAEPSLSRSGSSRPAGRWPGRSSGPQARRRVSGRRGSPRIPRPGRSRARSRPGPRRARPAAAASGSSSTGNPVSGRGSLSRRIAREPGMEFPGGAPLRSRPPCRGMAGQVIAGLFQAAGVSGGIVLPEEAGPLPADRAGPDPREDPRMAQESLSRMESPGGIFSPSADRPEGGGPSFLRRPAFRAGFRPPGTGGGAGSSPPSPCPSRGRPWAGQRGRLPPPRSPRTSRGPPTGRAGSRAGRPAACRS
jgi:hypothetical protein